MKPTNYNDQNALLEIEERLQKMKDLTSQASAKEAANDLIEAKILYMQARHLSIYTNKSLKTKIFNENKDRENWQQLNNKL